MSKKDTGLSSSTEDNLSRLVNSDDGSFNVKYKGGVTYIEDFYQTLVCVSWGRFLLAILILYVSVNSIFAGIYVALGVNDLAGAVHLNGLDAFLHAYYFSCQTFTTVGYGAIAPTSGPTNFVAAIEALVGLLAFALATGLVYGRFSKPKSHIKFSNHATISPFKDGKALMFRIVNRRPILMVDLEVKCIVSMVVKDPVNGNMKRDFYRLNFEIDAIHYFPLPWTIVHNIDNESPFHIYSLEEMKQANAEMIIQIKGFDESYGQLIYQRSSYTANEIIPDHRFVRNFDTDEEGNTVVDIDGLNHIEPI